MNCFSCCKGEHGEHDSPPRQQSTGSKSSGYNQEETRDTAVQSFTFRELAVATKNFHYECLVGEGGFGRVYKGVLPRSGQIVAVKQLDRNGMKGNNEFLSVVSSLSQLQHQNFAELIGYCANGDQRLLVYEFVAGGSLEDCLFGSAQKKALDWYTRIKIAFRIAQGLEYLHNTANPPVIYGDLKSSNVMLDEELVPKLSHHGLAMLVPSRDKTSHVSSMGTYGYSPPEYVRNGQVTVRSDVYSFGVILLELITGRRAIDASRPIDQQVLITWAQPFFRNPKKFPDMADPLIVNRCPEKDLNQVVGVAAMCLQDEPTVRPLIGDVVATLSFIQMEQ